MWPVGFDGRPADTSNYKSKWPPLFLMKGNEKWIPINTLEDQSTLTERYTIAAENFIKKNKNKAFFLYLPHSMPHVPINASPAFRGKSKQGLYGDVIQEIDASVGRILKTVKESGLDQNTIIIFSSDNGPWLNFGNHAGSTGGLREGKGTSFEGGQRVPGIIRWKGTIQPNVISNQLASTIDIFPTIAAITHTKLPNKKIDGVSILPILQGDKNASPRKTFLYYYRRNSLEAVRIDNWKLVLEHPSLSYLHQLPGMNGFPGTTPENVPMPMALYDLRRDPGENYDVKELHPDIMKKLQNLAEDARADLGDDLQKRIGAHNRPVGKINL